MANHPLLAISYTYALSSTDLSLAAEPLDVTSRFAESTPVEAIIEVANDFSGDWQMRDVRIRSIVVSMEHDRRVERIHEAEFSADGRSGLTLTDVPSWVRSLTDEALRLAKGVAGEE